MNKIYGESLIEKVIDIQELLIQKRNTKINELKEKQEEIDYINGLLSNPRLLSLAGPLSEGKNNKIITRIKYKLVQEYNILLAELQELI